MKEYLVKRRLLGVQIYVVEAKSKADALRKVDAGEIGMDAVVDFTAEKPFKAYSAELVN